ncbi:hypothetical protein MN608_06690 [Microdochium nivale]|nr:hypothetical protein MN608_06690 [Microdochium nivale]
MKLCIRSVVLLALASSTAQAGPARRLKCGGQPYGSICTSTSTEYQTTTESTTTTSTPATATATSTIFVSTTITSTVVETGPTLTAGQTVYFFPGSNDEGTDITTVVLTDTKTVTNYIPTIPTAPVVNPECKSATTTTVSVGKTVTSTNTITAPRPTNTVVSTSFLPFTMTVAAEPNTVSTTVFPTTYISVPNFTTIFEDAVTTTTTTIVDSYVTAEATPTPV